jgi:hypothetical protein
MPIHLSVSQNGYSSVGAAPVLVLFMLFHDDGMGAWGVTVAAEPAYSIRCRQFMHEYGRASVPANRAWDCVPLFDQNRTTWCRSKAEATETLMRARWAGYTWPAVNMFVRKAIAWMYRDVAGANRLLDTAFAIRVSGTAFWPPFEHMTPAMREEHASSQRAAEVAPVEGAVERTVERQRRATSLNYRQDDFDVARNILSQVDEREFRQLLAETEQRVERPQETREQRRRRLGGAVQPVVYPYTYEQINGPCVACQSVYVSEGVCWDCGARLLADVFYARPVARPGQAMGEAVRQRPRRRRDHPTFTEND